MFYIGVDNHNKQIQHDDIGSDGKNVTEPLMTYFSLRHGYKESYISVSAASESLDLETKPQWTLSTLSHEVMHSRVRVILEKIMQTSSDIDESGYSADDETNYLKWLNSDKGQTISTVLRNVVYETCLYWEFLEDSSRTHAIESMEMLNKRALNIKNIRLYYKNHRLIVTELLVHYHDFEYFYKKDLELYLQSIITSWCKVVQPFQDPKWYVIRCLAICAYCSGSEEEEALTLARATLKENLKTLQDKGITSPLISKFLLIIENQNTATSELARKVLLSYRLISAFAMHFQSKKIFEVLHKDDIDEKLLCNYSIFGEENQQLNPVQLSVVSQKKALDAEKRPETIGWSTAWNFMVISSQMRSCNETNIH
jgi:hypothetical protein